ncbi:MAG: teichuronic acid biosynthesis glycosyltransferase TuaG [Bacteroidia bacterium]|jgi:teichuronic acid biosynthesis glycosyltransferase TuaG
MQKRRCLISLITPFFNAEEYLNQSIESVLAQSFQNWELILINDGSSDNSVSIVKSFSDERIKYFEQENKGVSAARNYGLSKIEGSFFCFLDADDVMPEHSLSSRLEEFEKDEMLDFVDGKVIYVDQGLHPIHKAYSPNFSGFPMNRLLMLDQSCLFGNTWMIRRHKEVKYHFDENLTHAEDLYFYISICVQKEGRYTFTNEEILKYRQVQSSAMRNLKGLENGYYSLIKNIKHQNIASNRQLLYLKLKITKIMFLSYWFDGRDKSAALKVLSKYIWV